ncbi:hypothetical protein BHM03_00004319 [Ensete ventricosum]|nr:hypothetical protein BHM03_00004319 [Ensete ventricosum]
MVTFHPIADRFHLDMITFRSTFVAFALLQGSATFVSHVMTTLSIALDPRVHPCFRPSLSSCWPPPLRHCVASSLLPSTYAHALLSLSPFVSSSLIDTHDVSPALVP